MLQILRHCLRQPSESLVRRSMQSPSSYVVCSPMLVLTAQPKRYAGHSHWKNIKHTKEAKDAEKQKVTLNTMQRIRVAVREGGGTNPKLNSALARVIDEGKNRDVPMTTMLELLRKLEKSKDAKGSQLFVEAKGIQNSMLVIETYTDRPKWLRQNLQHILKKYGGTVGEAGMSKNNFRLKGVVYVMIDEAKKLNKDEALDAAIEAGAEDVVEGFDDYDRPAYQFLCDPKETHSVKKALNARGLQCGLARQEFIAHMHTQLEESTLKSALDMINELEAMDEVVKVYDNIELIGAQQNINYN